MRFLFTGIGELSRKIGRIFRRLSLRRMHQQVERAETELGRFAWREAEGVAGVREEFEKVRELEKKQTSLADQIADLEAKIETLRDEQAANQTAMQEALSGLESQRVTLVADQQAAVRQVSAMRNEISSLDREMHQLDDEQEALLREYADLEVASPPPPGMEVRQTEIKERRAAIPDDRAQIIQRRVEVSNQLSPVQENLALLESKIAILDKKIAGERSEYETKDRSLADIIRTYQSEISDARKRNLSLERDKHRPYLILGRRLADRDIAVKERPELMERVQELRRQEHEIEEQQNASTAASQEVDRADMRKFYLLLVALFLALVLIIWAVAAWGPKRSVPEPEPPPAQEQVEPAPTPAPPADEAPTPAPSPEEASTTDS